MEGKVSRGEDGVDHSPVDARSQAPLGNAFSRSSRFASAFRRGIEAELPECAFPSGAWERGAAALRRESAPPSHRPPAHSVHTLRCRDDAMFSILRYLVIVRRAM